MIEARGSRSALARAYTFFSLLYGRTAARLEREAVSRGLTRAQVHPGERVLEVAVGPGHVHERLGRRLGASGFLVGVDLAPGMLAATRRRLPEARLVRADALALPFPDDSFDLLWASYLLDLIPTEEFAPLLREFRRVLRADPSTPLPSARPPPAGKLRASGTSGRLLLVNFSKGGSGLTRWERLYERTPGWLVPYLFGGCRPVEAEPFVREAGFTDVEREFISRGLDSEIILARKGDPSLRSG